ncbi:hypothetical protein [Pantoea sp. DY-17]|uniref:hypothetical protein n=1 Tax=Pantoea sp. DY-17 TaxID=2871490 RepID=UPI001C93C0CB|nr:hypothetical protein [Pantoea sp. DY-17]MBY4951215.1 hypothetical protein [Pantoea sp. DY-17]
MSIEQASLIVAVIAMLISLIPILSLRKTNNIQKVETLKRSLLQNEWGNEGVIGMPIEPYLYLKIHDYPGFDKICGSLQIADIERDFIIYGKINASGVITCTLNATIGWREFPVCNIKFKYNHGNDQLTFIPLNRLKKINDDEVYEQGSFNQHLKNKAPLWRVQKIEMQ